MESILNKSEEIRNFYYNSYLNNFSFLEKCYLNIFARSNDGYYDEKFDFISNLIDDKIDNIHFKNRINIGKYKYENLGKLEKNILSLFDVFCEYNLIDKSNENLFIDSLLNLSKKYISLNSYKVINGILRSYKKL